MPWTRYRKAAGWQCRRKVARSTSRSSSRTMARASKVARCRSSSTPSRAAATTTPAWASPAHAAFSPPTVPRSRSPAHPARAPVSACPGRWPAPPEEARHWRRTHSLGRCRPMPAPAPANRAGVAVAVRRDSRKGLRKAEIARSRARQQARPVAPKMKSALQDRPRPGRVTSGRRSSRPLFPSSREQEESCTPIPRRLPIRVSLSRARHRIPARRVGAGKVLPVTQTSDRVSERRETVESCRAI